MFLENNNFIFTHVIVSRIFQRILFCNLIYNSDIDSKWFSFFQNFFKRIVKGTSVKVSFLKSFFLKHSKGVTTSFEKKKFIKPYPVKRNLLFFKKYKGFKFFNFYKTFNKPFFYNSLLSAFSQHFSKSYSKKISSTFKFIRYLKQLQKKKSI